MLWGSMFGMLGRAWECGCLLAFKFVSLHSGTSFKLSFRLRVPVGPYVLPGRRLEIVWHFRTSSCSARANTRGGYELLRR
ncbi:hypothetical protein BC830DRAFT_1158985 [Chytriomyces sp. MP71]|nr:hypothetical protein BC830DRAFT_1158985 [Chytriomyces sp. MP71]